MFLVSGDIRQCELFAEKTSLFNFSSQSNRKYFHLNTVDNLIYHFGEINNEMDKRWVYNSLRNYLESCKSFEEDITRNEGKQLYEQFLSKLVEYYDKNLDFSFVAGWTVFNLIYLTLFIVLYLIFNLVVALLVLPLYASRVIIIYKKYKEKRVYGLYY